MQVDQIGYFLERVVIDIIGLLFEIDNGNKYILVILDYFIKWMDVYLLRNIEVLIVVEVIVEQFIIKWGVLEIIYSEQGRYYESRLFKELCDWFGIRKIWISVFYFKFDGMVERFNKILVMMLIVYVFDYQYDWDKYLLYVFMVYCFVVYEIIGYILNMFMLG